MVICLKYIMSFISFLATLLVATTFLAAPASAEIGVYTETTLLPEIESESLTLYDKVKTGEYQKIGSVLGNLVDTVRLGGTQALVEESSPEASLLFFNEDSKVLVDLVFREDLIQTVPEIATSFASQGFDKTLCAGKVCSGYATIDSLPTLAANEEVLFVKPVIRPTKNTGSVLSEGDLALKADIARHNFWVNGTGMTVGVLSDSFNCLGGYARDIVTGDLPGDVIILDEYSESGCTDEGRAMLQIIHDVAPAAKLVFHTASKGVVEFAAGINALAAAGCDVIVDDSKFNLPEYFALPHLPAKLCSQHPKCHIFTFLLFLAPSQIQLDMQGNPIFKTTLSHKLLIQWSAKEFHILVLQEIAIDEPGIPLMVLLIQV